MYYYYYYYSTGVSIIAVALALFICVSAEGPAAIFAGPQQPQLTVFLACAWHAREWATTELCLEWARRASNDSRIRWVIVPEVNAEASLVRSGQRDACARCNARGIDLNRNWARLADSICPEEAPLPRKPRKGDEDYGGETPLSEPEVLRIENLLRLHRPDLAFFVHTGGEMILAPYDTCRSRRPPHYRLYVKLAQWLSDEITPDVDSERHPLVGSGARMLYRTLGSAVDHATHVLGVPFAFTLETYSGEANCSADPVGFHHRATDTMKPDDCRLTFVPHSPQTCRVDLGPYLARWGRLVDALRKAPQGDLDLIAEWVRERRNVKF